jgi:hypothetical protein
MYHILKINALLSANQRKRERVFLVLNNTAYQPSINCVNTQHALIVFQGIPISLREREITYRCIRGSYQIHRETASKSIETFRICIVFYN